MLLKKELELVKRRINNSKLIFFFFSPVAILFCLEILKNEFLDHPSFFLFVI